jgi:tetratricopeptide (TPR) repeat protein
MRPGLAGVTGIRIAGSTANMVHHREQTHSGMISRLLGRVLPVRRETEDWLHSGDNLMREARLDEAFRCFEEAVRKEPGKAAGWKRRGVSLGLMGHFHEAADSFARATDADPSDREACMCRGFCLVRTLRYQEALDCFCRVRQLCPEDEYARYWCDLLKEETSGRGPGLGRTARLEPERAVESRG